MSIRSRVRVYPYVVLLAFPKGQSFASLQIQILKLVLQSKLSLEDSDRLVSSIFARERNRYYLAQ